MFVFSLFDGRVMELWCVEFVLCRWVSRFVIGFVIVIVVFFCL